MGFRSRIVLPRCSNVYLIGFTFAAIPLFSIFTLTVDGSHLPMRGMERAAPPPNGTSVPQGLARVKGDARQRERVRHGGGGRRAAHQEAAQEEAADARGGRRCGHPASPTPVSDVLLDAYCLDDPMILTIS